MLLGIWDSDYVKLDRVIVQIVAAGLGCCAMVVISRIDYQTMADLWRLHLPLAYALVGLTFVLGIGRADDMAWLRIPFVGLTFQPSELLKLSFIITFAYHLQKAEDNLNQPGVLVPVLCHAAVPVLLIMLQGDHGSAMVFLFVACGMLFTAGLAWKYILAAGGLSIAALPVIWYGLMDEDKRMRIITLFNPDLDPAGSGYQQRLGRIALGSGKLWGKGVFSGNHQYVPEMYNDFIFSFIGEALGLIGCLLVLGCAHSTLPAHPAGEPPGQGPPGAVHLCGGLYDDRLPDGDECGHVPECAAGDRRYTAPLFGRRHLGGGHLPGHRAGHECFDAQQPAALYSVRLKKSTIRVERPGVSWGFCPEFPRDGGYPLKKRALIAIIKAEKIVRH